MDAAPWGRGGQRGRRGRGNYSRGRGGGGGRPPPGLQGRDIGMFYARRSRANARSARSVLTLSSEQRSVLAQEIQALRSKDDDLMVTSKGKGVFSNAWERNKEANRRAQVPRLSLDAPDFHRDPDLDARLAEADQALSAPLAAFRRQLPAFKMRQALLDLIKENQVSVINGETGCGKTTQVPQFILESALAQGFGSLTRIICTQPRRISAISIAERVAEERAEPLGCSVGYQIRLESRLPRERGSILYCTTGVVLQRMRTEPNLDGVSHIILDEIHERDVQSDFLITVLKDLLPLRPDLKVILMSATLNAHLFSKYFHHCPMMNIPGYTFPVEEFYLEDVLEMTRFTIGSNSREQPHDRPVPKWHQHTRRGRDKSQASQEFEKFVGPFLRQMRAEGKYSPATIQSLSREESEELNHELIATLIHHIHVRERDGAILVFVPGWDDISKVNTLLTKDDHHKLRGNVQIYPLHSLMPSINQKEILTRPPPGVRKIVIATNIAETSITIDDVVYVVDCGKIKMTNYDPESNLATLKPEWVAEANARQRRGRAGRVQPGVCYHLFSRARAMILDQFVKPEILRTKLDELILQIKALGFGQVRPFFKKVMEAPDDLAITRGLELLTTINALDDEEQLTALGFHLVQLPMDPQTAKMVLLSSIFGCVDPILSIAASLTFKDAFMIPLGKEKIADQKRKELSRGTKSDHLLLSNAMYEWEEACKSGRSRQFCWDFFLSESVLRMLSNMKKQFAQYLHQQKFLASPDYKAPECNQNSHNEDLLKAIICAGLYPNVASVEVKRRGPNGFVPMLRTSTERRVCIHPKSVNANESRFFHPWMVFHLLMKSNSVLVHDCSEISPMSLIFFGETLKLKNEEGSDGTCLETISINPFLTFNCSLNTGVLFKTLRSSWDKLLEFKIMRPGVTDWNTNRYEGALLRTIIHLLSCNPQCEIIDNDDDEGY